MSDFSHSFGHILLVFFLLFHFHACLLRLSLSCTFPLHKICSLSSSASVFLTLFAISLQLNLYNTDSPFHNTCKEQLQSTKGSICIFHNSSVLSSTMHYGLALSLCCHLFVLKPQSRGQPCQAVLSSAEPCCCRPVWWWSPLCLCSYLAVPVTREKVLFFECPCGQLSVR